MPLVDELEVRVEAVVGVATAVVLKRPAFVWRIDGPADRGAVGLRVDVPVLVDVVADVEEEVEIVPLGHPAVDVEVARRVLGAGDEREADAIRRPVGAVFVRPIGERLPVQVKP